MIDKVKFLIAHRGNITGKQPDRENSPDYVMQAISSGYHAEVDVWYVDGNWYLGHDSPQHQVGSTFLLNESLWCHAKNIEALPGLVSIGAHCFWHQSDDVTLTSKGYLWTYPGQLLTERSICVKPEEQKVLVWHDCIGICSDYIENYKNI